MRQQRYTTCSCTLSRTLIGALPPATPSVLHLAPAFDFFCFALKLPTIEARMQSDAAGQFAAELGRPFFL